jgi:hypothetical protein
MANRPGTAKILHRQQDFLNGCRKAIAKLALIHSFILEAESEREAKVEDGFARWSRPNESGNRDTIYSQEQTLVAARVFFLVDDQ